MKLSLQLFILTFFSNILFAGWQYERDSLEALLKVAQDDSIRIDLMLKIGDATIGNTPEEALEYYLTASNTASEINDSQLIAKCLIYESDYYLQIGEAASALNLVLKADDLSENSNYLMALCHNRLSGIYHYMEDFDKSLKHDRLSMKYSIANGDTDNIYIDLQNIAGYYLENELYDSALMYYYKSLDMSVVSTGEQDPYALSLLGLTYTYMEEFDSAIYYHFKSYNYHKNKDILIEQAIDEHNIGLTYFKMGEYEKAIKYSYASVDKAIQLRLYDILYENYSVLHQIYSKQAKYNLAYQYSLLSQDYLDTVKLKSNEAQIIQLESRYKVKESRVKLQAKESELMLAQSQKQLFIALSLIGFLLLISTIAIIILVYRRHAANKIILEKLNEANKSKERLISVVSHDLRGSIGTMRNAVELIVDDTLDYNGVKDLMSSFYPVVDSTYDLLENLLTWAREAKENLEPTLEEFNIKQIVDTSILHTNYLSESKQITILNYVEQATINADKNMMQTVVRNLISNAIKFSKPDSSIIVTSATSKGACELMFKDQGIGIKKEVLETIFNMPLDYHSTGTMGERGSGLGLSLCKSFIEKHGGKIWAESQPGKGSTFFITIPYSLKN